MICKVFDMEKPTESPSMPPHTTLVSSTMAAPKWRDLPPSNPPPAAETKHDNSFATFGYVIFGVIMLIIVVGFIHTFIQSKKKRALNKWKKM